MTQNLIETLEANASASGGPNPIWDSAVRSCIAIVRQHEADHIGDANEMVAGPNERGAENGTGTQETAAARNGTLNRCREAFEKEKAAWRHGTPNPRHIWDQAWHARDEEVATLNRLIENEQALRRSEIPVAADVSHHKFDTSDYALIGTHPARKREEQCEIPLMKPSEAMCDEARGFIIGLDLGIRNFRDMRLHLERGGYSNLPCINAQALESSAGHITKWDVADCIWQLMARAHPVPTPKREAVEDTWQSTNTAPRDGTDFIMRVVDTYLATWSDTFEAFAHRSNTERVLEWKPNLTTTKKTL